MAPRDTDPWSDALVCDTFGATCVQNITASMKQAQFTEPSHSENCLFLNIFAPETLPEDPCPVLVWIHGGAGCRRRLSRSDPKEFAIDRKHGTEKLRPQNLTAQMVNTDLSGNEITVRA